LSDWIGMRDGRARIEKSAPNRTTFITCS
jgi:hypothetical protein